MTMIRVGPQVPEFRCFADFVDGARARIQRVELTVSDRWLVITPPEATPRHWSLDDLRRLPDQAADDMLVLRVEGDAVARLILTDRDAIASLMPRCPNLTRRAKVENRNKLFGWGAAALASVALIIFVLVPTMANQLARFLPPEGEQALGDATLSQIRSALDDTGLQPLAFCEKPQGRAALGKLSARMTEGVDLPYPLRLHVLDHEMVNAFALPGGHVVLFRGLIDAAESPDEIAAVFAHELGHVVARDPARGALRSAGSIGVLGLLFGDFAGGTVVLFLANQLINATYTQDAEAAADAFALQRLKDTNVDPGALADFFDRLRSRHGEPPELLAHFAAHPQLGDRIAIARAAQVTAKSRPVLTPDQWQALRRICR